MRGVGNLAASGALATVLLLALPWLGASAILETLGNPVQITEFAATSLNVTWDAAPASYRYDLRWRPAGAAEYDAGKELPGDVRHYFMAGLLEGTQYEMLLQVSARSRNESPIHTRLSAELGKGCSRAATNLGRLSTGEPFCFAWSFSRTLLALDVLP
jgi:hypothetical protein